MISFRLIDREEVFMNVKRIAGFVAVVVGVVLIAFSFVAKGKVAHAKEGMDQVSGFFPKDAVSSTVEHKMHSKLSQYEMMIRWSMIGGAVLVAAGAFVVFRYRKG